MRNFSCRSGKIVSMLLALLLALLPPTCLGETSVTADSASESLFDDDEYYAWLYGGEEDEITGEELALANLLILWDYNSGVADWCRQEAAKLPENSETRKEYEDFAVILQTPMPDRPTEEESKALAEQYLANVSSQLQAEAVEYYRRCVAAEPVLSSLQDHGGLWHSRLIFFDPAYGSVPPGFLPQKHTG